MDGKSDLLDQLRQPYKHSYSFTDRSGLANNIAQQTTLFALSNLWMVRKRLLNAGEVRL